MCRCQNSGKSNCRKNKTEHVVSPVAGLRPDRADDEECLEYGATSLKCFTPLRGRSILRIDVQHVTRARRRPRIKTAAARELESNQMACWILQSTARGG